MQALGLNMIRLHQKTNPQRYYYHADRLGMVIQQDMVQHCKRPIIRVDLVSDSNPEFSRRLPLIQRCLSDGDRAEGSAVTWASSNGIARAKPYFADLRRMIDTVASHPSVIQYELFNENDMVSDVTQ